MTISNHHSYAEQWIKETDLLEANGIYEKLAAAVPLGRVLEIGCGAGKGTSQLIQQHEVLSLDNNPHLIDAARQNVCVASNVTIHECNLFTLTENDKKIISSFQPNAIVGWFLGGCGEDIFSKTEGVTELTEKAKLYREKLEDIIISEEILIDTVNTINLVYRGKKVSHLSDQEVKDSQAKNYNTYVFDQVGFKVTDVRLFDWPREGSDFTYGAAHNPNLVQGATNPIIISLIAQRT
ncbi:class I SAM-dependent methyltransferase [Acetobacter oryzifermentans]|uniref:class I SAM-dependent methyltransferase n=1 Tax=Acetobacter oryzifermentans TaxID=1633874 RepID=UPI000A4D4A17|nr:class I SAM-dependent methyltransferase [Acetobacter oryzifermentans]